MPPKNRFTKEEIIDAALTLAREGGMKAVTARALGARLGSSAKPVFGLFQNMTDLQQELLAAANKLYQSYLAQDMASDQYPPYKASGMGYIRFAKEERELFKLLFMRDRTGEPITESNEELAPILDILCQNTGLSREQAYRFHISMWLYVHGIATMIATGYLAWDTNDVSDLLTDAYTGMLERYCRSKQEKDVTS